MALVKRTDLPVRPWHSADARQTAVRLPRLEKQPAIDYERLRNLCRINGLKDVQNGILQTTEEAHQHFMENYKDIFAKGPKKLGFPIHSEQREQHKVSLLSLTHNATGKTIQSEKKKAKEWPVDRLTHNISDYLGLLHKQRKMKDPELIQQDNLKTLRKILRKLPFQRTAADNDKIFNILRTFPFFKEHIPDPVLKELCVVALLEVWKDPEFTIFGSTGLHMVLQGKVAPISYPYINIDDVAIEGSVTPVVLTEPDELLTPGQYFGTLKTIEGREPGSKVFSVITKDNNCEFLKIPATDYVRVIEQIKHREHTEKENLLQSCSQYKLWPRQPLIEVAELIEWISYPPNTVIVSEGYMAPFIGFIQTGECHILRQVEVVHTLKNGEREKRTKQVVMGRLGPSESFAELSVLLNEQITCSVVTATGVTLGIIKPEKIKDLDEVTIQLFKQSNNRTFGDLTKEDIQDEYMQQELKREWNEFKHGILLEVINSRGIRPGYGKWSK